MDIKGGNIVQGQPDSEQLNSHTFPKLPVYATIGRRSMARVHLAQGFETPIWTGSPQGVVCFTTSSPSSKAGAFTERKNSKRWSFYGGSGNSKRDSSSHNGNDKMTSRKKGNKSHEHRNGVNGVSGNGKCPPPSPLRLTPEPEDITDRLCLRRRWTTRESSKRPVNVFEPQTHDGDDTEPGKKIPLWKAVNANISSEDNPVVPVSSQSLMYSWKGKESPPDVPDSRQILSDDPVSSLMRSPKPTRSLSVESTISTSGSSTISNTRSLSLRRTNCPSLLGSYLASSEGNDGDDDKSGSALALIRKKPSLRKIELPKLENHMPSLDQVKALLLEEARNLSDTVRAIPMPSRPSSSQEGTADLSLAKRVGAASSTSNLLAKLSGSFVTNSDTISPDQKHKVISVPVIQTMPLLHRNHSLKLHDRPNSNFKPLIRRKPTIYNGKLNQNNSAEGADVRPTSKPNSVTSTVISDAPQRLTSRSSNSSDSQCAALSSLSASTTSSLYTERGASDQQPLLSALTSNDDRNRPVDIRHDIDDVLIMDLLKNLNINANEKNLLRQTSKQRQCQCISPPPSIQEQRSRGKTVASASIKHQQGLHCIVPIEDPHSSGNTVLTNSENEQDAQDYADASSVQRPSYDPSVSSSGPSISSDLLLDKDQEILSAWLRSIQSEECLGLFVAAGYDMPTISRMTPEDLTAIGVTKPAHRRRLFAEISKLNISDGIPDYKPDSLSLLLKLLRLEEYEATLVSQGYDSVDKVAELTWEDIDDIGITKLGHQKKLTLAIKKIKNFPRFQPAFRPLAPSSSSHHSFARHSSIDLGNPHARPITVPVPPEQYESAAWMPTPLQHSVSQTESLTLPHHRQVNEFNRQIEVQLADEQLYFAWQQQQEHDAIFAQQPALRGRSLESLEHNFEWYDLMNSWRNQMMTDASGGGPHYIEGTSTLQRPRGLLGHKTNSRPVAKVQGTSTVSIRDQITTNASGCGSSGQEHGDATDEAAKSELLAGQGPIPPKRGGGSSVLPPAGVTKAHDVGDTAFATCVQSLTSRFTLDTCEGGEGIEGSSNALSLSLAAHGDAHALALARSQLSSASSAHIPWPPPPPEPPATAGSAGSLPLSTSGSSTTTSPSGPYRPPRSPRRERSPVPPGDSTALAPQMIELNQAMQSELKIKLKQRNHQAVGSNNPAVAAQDQHLKELPKPAKSDADLEREKFLAKLESVRKKSERKEGAVSTSGSGITGAGGLAAVSQHQQNGKGPLLARKGVDKDKEHNSDRKVTRKDGIEDPKDKTAKETTAGSVGKDAAKGSISTPSSQQVELNNGKKSCSMNRNPIEKEIRSLQECVASVMDPKAEPTTVSRSGTSVEDDPTDYDTNPFTALLSKIEKNVDKEFLARKRNEKAATAKTASSNTTTTTATKTTTTATMTTSNSSARPSSGNGTHTTNTSVPSHSHSSNVERTISYSTANNNNNKNKASHAHTVSSNHRSSTNGASTKIASGSGAATGVGPGLDNNSLVIDTSFKRLSSSSKGGPGYGHHQSQPAAPSIDIRPIEVKLEGPGFAGTSTINNLNRPYEIARSTKAEPILTQNKFFSTIGVETKVINLEDRPHRKSDAGLPSARVIIGNSYSGTASSNNSGDNHQPHSRQISADGSRMTSTPGHSIPTGIPVSNKHHQLASTTINGNHRVHSHSHSQTPSSQSQANNKPAMKFGKQSDGATVVRVGPDASQQLQAAQAEFDNKFENLNNVSKESEKEKRILEVQEVYEISDEQSAGSLREGLVSSARKIFEIVGGGGTSKTSPGNSGSPSPAIPRRNSVKRDNVPAPPPRPQRAPEVPPRNLTQTLTTTVASGAAPQDFYIGESSTSAVHLPSKNPPRRVPETPKVIQDIEHMLSSLTDQLDAMLD